MKTVRWAILAGGGSVVMLAGAFAFQHIGGLAPCKMCLWQRWPHAIAIILAALFFVFPSRAVAFIAAGTVAVGAAIALYHTGVERLWWQGPTTCTSGSISGLSTNDLLNQILQSPVVRCDEVAWSLLGLSMASWNGIISLVLIGFWIKIAWVHRLPSG